jgi:hypothetical protein
VLFDFQLEDILPALFAFVTVSAIFVAGIFIRFKIFK